MIHLLIIAEDNVVFPPLAAPSTSVDFKLLRKPNLAAARPLLETGMLDVCLLAVAGAWLFWPQGNRLTQRPPGGEGAAATAAV